MFSKAIFPVNTGLTKKKKKASFILNIAENNSKHISITTLGSA